MPPTRPSRRGQLLASRGAAEAAAGGEEVRVIETIVCPAVQGVGVARDQLLNLQVVRRCEGRCRGVLVVLCCACTATSVRTPRLIAITNSVFHLSSRPSFVTITPPSRTKDLCVAFQKLVGYAAGARSRYDARSVVYVESTASSDVRLSRASLGALYSSPLASILWPLWSSGRK